MSQSKFLSQRLETIQKSQAIDIKAKEILINKIREIETYVPCTECIHFEGGNCAIHKNEVPAEIIAVGCGSGEYIPF